jgi:O-antigen ligase
MTTLAAPYAWTGPPADLLDEQIESLAAYADQRAARAPLIIVLLIGLFALTVILFGTSVTLFRIPYYLGVLTALLSVLVYFQYSLPIPTPVFFYVAWVFWALLTALGAEMAEAIKLSLQTVLQIMVMVAIFATVCQDARSVWIVGAFMVIGALGNLFSALVLGVRVTGGRAAGLATNPNGAALVYDTGICVLLALTAVARRPSVRVGSAILVAVLLYGVVTTGSRAGAVASVLPVMYFLWFYRRTIARKPGLIFGLICIFLASILFLPAWLSETDLGKRWTAMMETLQGTARREEASTRSRVELKYKAIGVALEHPILGVGVGNFTPYVFRKEGETLSTHDNYLDILSGTGFPGFFLYYSIYVWLWWTSGRLRQSPLVTPTEVGLLAMTRTFIICRAVWDFFDNTGWSSKPAWMLMALMAGFLMGLRQRLAQRESLAVEHGLV